MLKFRFKNHNRMKKNESQSVLFGKKILIGISGSIAAYKVPELIRLLIKEGAEDFLHNTDHADSLRTQASGLSTSNIMQFINRLIQTLSNLDNNANPRLTMEVLMINLPIEAGTV